MRASGECSNGQASGTGSDPSVQASVQASGEWRVPLVLKWESGWGLGLGMQASGDWDWSVRVFECAGERGVRVTRVFVCAGEWGLGLGIGVFECAGEL